MPPGAQATMTVRGLIGHSALWASPAGKAPKQEAATRGTGFLGMNTSFRSLSLDMMANP